MGFENRSLTPAEQTVAARLRKIAAKLPGVTETRDKFGHTTFKVGKQSLVLLGDHDGTPSLGIKTDVITQAALIKGGGFYRPPYIGQHGWVSIEGTAKQLDWEVIEEVLTDTYRAVAPKKLLAQLDDKPTKKPKR
jgi:hypothetical protein